jgi:hypothetical protein
VLFTSIDKDYEKCTRSYKLGWGIVINSDIRIVVLNKDRWLRAVHPRVLETPRHLDGTQAMTTSSSGIVQAIIDVMEALASQFECARVDGPTTDSRGARLELSCSKPGTARVVVYVRDDSIDVTLGEWTGWDVYRGRRGLERRMVKFGRLLEAVAIGGLQESSWERKGRTVRQLGKLRERGGRILHRWRDWSGFGAVMPGQRRTVVDYAPYS